MTARKTTIGTLALALALVGTSGFAAAPSEPASGDQAQLMKGTIQGEVKKVQPDAVIVQVEADNDKADKQEVRLPLHQSTHMGPVKEGDQVTAYVTPGGTTTSIQPSDSRWYR